MIVHRFKSPSVTVSRNDLGALENGEWGQTLNIQFRPKMKSAGSICDESGPWPTLLNGIVKLNI